MKFVDWPVMEPITDGIPFDLWSEQTYNRHSWSISLLTASFLQTCDSMAASFLQTYNSMAASFLKIGNSMAASSLLPWTNHATRGKWTREIKTFDIWKFLTFWNEICVFFKATQIPLNKMCETFLGVNKGFG